MIVASPSLTPIQNKLSQCVLFFHIYMYIFFFPQIQGTPVLLVISCDKDFQLCSEFIKKGFGKEPLSRTLIACKQFEKILKQKFTFI